MTVKKIKAINKDQARKIARKKYPNLVIYKIIDITPRKKTYNVCMRERR